MHNPTQSQLYGVTEETGTRDKGVVHALILVKDALRRFLGSLEATRDRSPRCGGSAATAWWRVKWCSREHCSQKNQSTLMIQQLEREWTFQINHDLEEFSLAVLIGYQH